jgi:intein/homing endonuclease
MNKLSKNNFQNPLYNISDLKLAYLAGFIDGDGCINGQIIKSNDYKRKFKLQVSVVFYQKSSRR